MNYFYSLINFILDILFPIKCLGCGREFEDREPKERWICKNCLDGIIIRKEQVCPVCEKESEGGKTCYHCREKTGLDGLWVASEYSDVLLSKAIHKFKFSFVRDLSYPLSKIILKSVLEQEEFSDFQDLLFSRNLEVNNNLLVRWRNTKPQTKIKSMAERKKNIKGAFKINQANQINWGHIKPVEGNNNIPERKILENKNIIIVDDVCTTLATLNECAAVIKKAGAKKVWGLVVARR